MSVLNRLISKFKPEPKVNAVSVYLRDQSLIVITEHAEFGGVPCIEAGPITTLPATALANELGAAIKNGLALTKHDFKGPVTREDWKPITARLPNTVGAKTWKQFAIRANNLGVRQTGEVYDVNPMRRDKQGAFFSLDERKAKLTLPTEQQLGEVVLAELRLAREQEGP